MHGSLKLRYSLLVEERRSTERLQWLAILRSACIGFFRHEPQTCHCLERQSRSQVQLLNYLGTDSKDRL
jgi:hypothetical protein